MGEFKKKPVNVLWSLPLLHFFEKAAIPVILVIAAFFIGKNISQPKQELLVAEIVDTIKVDDTLTDIDSSTKFIEGNSVGSIPVSVTE